MRHFKGKSVLYRYLASFISVAMFSCVIIGAISYIAADQGMKKSAEAEQRKRLTLAAEDLSSQFELLQEISHRVQTTNYYTPSYIGRNPYYEVEMMEDLQKYRGYSTLYTYYFLHYENSDLIHTAAGKSFFQSYGKLLFDLSDTTELMNALNECKKESFFSVPKGTIASFPINMIAGFGYTGKATLNFYLTRQSILDRAQLVSGENFKHMSIVFDDQCILDDVSGDTISVAHGRFRLLFDKNELDANNSSQFLNPLLLLVLIFALLSCALAVWVAIQNYRPIEKLAKRHNLAAGYDELDRLDKALVNMEGKLRISQEQLDVRVVQFKKLRNMLQEHFVERLLQGDIDKSTLTRMQDVGMNFPGQLFFAFILRFHDAQNESELKQTISELADDNTSFYMAAFKEDLSYAVVVNTDCDEGLRDIISEAFPEAEVYGGYQTETINDIPTLLFYALTETEPSYINPSDIARNYEDKHLREFRKALEAGDEAQAIQSLKEYYTIYLQGDQTLQTLIRNNVITTLLLASYEINMSVPRTFLQGKYETWALLEGWASAICNSKSNMSQNEEHQIIQYLRENALDFNLSLENVAAYFHRSSRQIARIVQAETDCNYRTFISQLRMEHAKEMLREGKSVSEVSEAVCYMSKSHFIRTFTNYAGMTPSRYREYAKGESKEERTE